MSASDDFKHITIISVNGVKERVAGALNALLLSSRHMPGAQCVLVSPYLPDSAPRHIKHVPIAPIGYLEYGVFVLYCLGAFIKTEFALIVQDDGWVLNPNRWQSRFLDYDVIGAPAQIARVHTPQGAKFVRRYEWAKADSGWSVDMVHNGGFTLRSGRALKMPRSLDIAFQIPAVTELQGPPYVMQFPNEQAHEDVQMCTLMRRALESAGVKFAPLDIARSFSIEHVAPGVHDGFNFADLFGHHSTHRKLISIDPPIVQYKTSEQDTVKIIGEQHILKLLAQLGYEVLFTASA